LIIRGGDWWTERKVDKKASVGRGERQQQLQQPPLLCVEETVAMCKNSVTMCVQRFELITKKLEIFDQCDHHNDNDQEKAHILLSHNEPS